MFFPQLLSTVNIHCTIFVFFNILRSTCLNQGRRKRTISFFKISSRKSTKLCSSICTINENGWLSKCLGLFRYTLLYNIHYTYYVVNSDPLLYRTISFVKIKQGKYVKFAWLTVLPGNMYRREHDTVHPRESIIAEQGSWGKA